MENQTNLASQPPQVSNTDISLHPDDVVVNQQQNTPQPLSQVPPTPRKGRKMLFITLGIAILLVFIFLIVFWFKNRAVSLINSNNGAHGQQTDFTHESSLPDKQKIGIWNADSIKVVTDIKKAPQDGSSYIDFSQFDSTAKNLNMTPEKKKKIEDLTVEAVKDLFVSKNSPHSDFFTNYFFVKKVKVYFQVDSDYKDVYSFSDGQLKMVISYRFVDDWFVDDDDAIIIKTSDGQGVRTGGPIVTILWFDYMNGEYAKLAQPVSIPNYNFPRLNSDQYPLFVKGFGEIISQEEALEIADTRLPNRNSNYSSQLQILDETLYPSIIVRDDVYQKKAQCPASPKFEDNYSSQTCQINLLNKDISCEEMSSTCATLIPL